MIQSDMRTSEPPISAHTHKHMHAQSVNDSRNKITAYIYQQLSPLTAFHCIVLTNLHRLRNPNKPQIRKASPQSICRRISGSFMIRVGALSVDVQHFKQHTSSSDMREDRRCCRPTHDNAYSTYHKPS